MSAPEAFTQQEGGANVALAEKHKLYSGSSLGDESPSIANEDLNQEHDVVELARKYTSESTHHGHESPFDASEGSRLDPHSNCFRARDWAKSFYNLRYSSDKAIPRVSGFAFLGLNVSGTGSPTDFQSTVGNNILKIPALFGRGNQRIEILRDLDCLLLPGEQLCVLGPPG